MVGLEDLADGAVARCNHLVASRLDGDAVTDDLLGEDNVRYIFDRHDFARQRSKDFDAAGVRTVIGDQFLQFIKQTHSKSS
ncbi:hypothetical protein D3C76_588500 [compost metagenome]